MTPSTPASSARRSKLRTVAWSFVFLAMAATSYFAGKRSEADKPPPKSVVVERPMPSVVLAVQSLARLQSVAFHMERIVDLTKKEQALWGLVETQDNILLVAVGDVEAGIDLGKIQKHDVTVDEHAKKVRIVLPPAEVFAARLDNDRTYVHSRKTDVLGKPDMQLETEARQRAERAIHQGALDAGILKHAEDSAASTVRSLALSLGYQIVLVETKRGG
jgi:hypothetical protein